MSAHPFSDSTEQRNRAMRVEILGKVYHASGGSTTEVIDLSKEYNAKSAGDALLVADIAINFLVEAGLLLFVKRDKGQAGWSLTVRGARVWETYILDGQLGSPERLASVPFIGRIEG